jgi:hypothetical protein
LGTRTERTAPESAIERRTLLFTARCRLPSEPTHNIKDDHDRPQPAAKDER